MNIHITKNLDYKKQFISWNASRIINNVLSHSFIGLLDNDIETLKFYKNSN
ncbi:hypothetical protein HYD72_00885 [Mycoplasmopsis bovis]|nr:hypothetical protein [Mycoplasmopsis bovis]QQH49240.1 hypothetical protein HYD72_00885 [Mycoplasmopsis bovis]